MKCRAASLILTYATKAVLVLFLGILFLSVFFLMSIAYSAPLVERDNSGMYVAQDGEAEVISDRTRSFKKFTKGRVKRIAGQIGPIHYRADPFSETEPYKEIDLDIVLTPGEDWDAAMESNGYQVRLWNSRQIAGKTVRYIAQFRRAGKWLAMAPMALLWENNAGQRELISKPTAGIIPEIDNDTYRVAWADCFGSGLHYRYNLRPDEFFKTLVVNSVGALPVPSIDTADLYLTLSLGLAWDTQSKLSVGFADNATPSEIPNDISGAAIDEELVGDTALAYQDSVLRDVFWMQKPKAWDAAGNILEMKWRLRRKGNSVFGLFSVPYSALSGAVYPVYIDAAIGEEQVGASGDDGYVRYNFPNNDTHPTAPDNIQGYFNGSFNRGVGGYRFTSIPVDQGSVVDSAVLTFHCAVTGGGNNCNTSIAMADVDDASSDLSTFANWDAYWTALTTATITWNVVEAFFIGSTYNSLDFKAVAEEVFMRGGWVSGNDIVIFWGDEPGNSDVNAHRRTTTYDGSTVNAAKLNASFTAPSSGAQVIIISNH